jgi:Icc protein
MKRRNFLRSVPLVAAAGSVTDVLAQAPQKKEEGLAFTVAHITDVHIRPDFGIPERFKKCLQEVLTHKIDFILNTGDSIHAADYKDITRERVLEQWAVWDDCMKLVKGYEMYSAIGNHDPWWAAPSNTDEMYGLPYAVKRVGIPNRYYSFTKKNWHFMVLDGNNAGITIDPPQMEWLKAELSAVPANHHVLVMSHYPIITVTDSFAGGGSYKDYKELKQLFYQHGKKVKVCLSGHQHLLDNCVYNDIHYLCNGAMSGFWWEDGDKFSAGRYYLQETPPGYAILRLYEDGRIENMYHQHHY